MSFDYKEKSERLKELYFEIRKERVNIMRQRGKEEVADNFEWLNDLMKDTNVLM